MIVTKPMHHLLGWDRAKQPVVIPDWLKEYARSWCEAGAKSVYLYGSRSNGYYLPDSDWDIAVVYESERLKAGSSGPDSHTPSWTEINVIQFTDEEIHNRAQKQPNVASEIIQSKLIEGEELSMPRAKHIPDRDELKRHLVVVFNASKSTLTGINARWLSADVPNEELDDLEDHDTESTSALAAERLVKALCCLYDQPYEKTHKVSEFIEILPDDYAGHISKMNGSTHKLGISPYEGGPLESCQDSLNRIIYTLNLLDKVVKQGDLELTQEERRYIQKEYRVGARKYADLTEEETHPDIVQTIFRMDGTIEGLSN